MRNSVFDKDKKEVDINASIGKAKNAIEENKKKLEKEIKEYEKEIKGYNKQITNNKKAIASLGYVTTRKEEQIEGQEDLKENQEANLETEDLFYEKSKIINANVKKEEKQVIKAKKKPRWFQFIKRFKNWRANRKMASSMKKENKINVKPIKVKPIEIKPIGSINKESQENATKNDFTQSLKYQVVRDIAEQMQKEKLEEIKNKNKEDSER